MKLKVQQIASLFFILFFWMNTTAQSDSTQFFKPYLLSNHPLGIFTSRIDHNFNFKPIRKLNLSFTISRGNVWLPFTTNKLANKQSDKDLLSKFSWYDIEKELLKNNITDYQTRTFEADGIFSTYLLKVNLPLSKNWDCFFHFKMNHLTGGETPYSLTTSDQAIEWFHDHVSLDGDLFARRMFPFNQAYLNYTDEDGNQLKLKDNQLFVSEISSDFHYYLTSRWLIRKNIKMNTGIHPGLSFMNRKTLFNLGLSVSGNKMFTLRNKKKHSIGFAGSILAPAIFQKQPVNINTNKQISSLEINWNYYIPLNKNWFVIGINYHFQSSYHKMSERKYHSLSGVKNTSHWHYAMSRLNIPLQGWSFIFSYKVKKTTISTFFREDFIVDNSPDFQVGWGINQTF